jgi:adenosylhomocysteine nucleosidase
MKRHLLVVVLCLTYALLLSSCRAAPRREPACRPLAVLGAVTREVTLLQGLVTDAKPVEIEGIEFVAGRIGKAPVVIAWTGIGKVNAAMTTTLLLEHFHPTRVLFTGIAGGVDPNLEPGDIVVAKQTAYHDMGTLSSAGIDYGGVRSRMTGEPNPVFFPADPELLAAAQRAAQKTAFDPVQQQTGPRRVKVVAGTVVTGDVFVASKEKGAKLAKELGASAVEMEGAAVAQLCYQRGVGCLVIRSISDKADQSALMDKQLFYAMAVKNSANLVVKIIIELPQNGD